MAEQEHGSSVATYIIIAVILGVITYVEFALVEYPQAWLGSTWTMVWLVVLSIAKFVLVILFFMHLKDDNPTYSAFFSSGMLFALGTFIAFAVLFIAPRSMHLFKEELAPTHEAVVEQDAEEHAVHGIDPAILANVASGGYSRSPVSIADNPPPKNQSIAVPLPAAKRNTGSYTVGTIQSFATATAGASNGAAGGAAEGAAEGATPAGGSEAAAPAAPTWDTQLGSTTFDTHCMACHQANGQGIPSAFPPLAEHLPDVYNADGGRDYLIHTVLFGLHGQIDVLGTSYNGVMPAWGQLGDDEIAAVLNHELTSWGNDALVTDFKPIEASEVTTLRADALSADDVLALREQLTLP